MDFESIVALVNREVYCQTQKHLTDLQQTVITEVLQRRKYIEIADNYGCTEGHAKDTGSLLWKLLSKAWGKKVTKSNFRSLSKLQLKSVTILNSGEIDLSVSEQRNFLGRQKAIATIEDLVTQNHKIIVLQGEGGVGKTTLAQQFLARQNFSLVLEVLMAKEAENIISVVSVLEEWLQRDLKEDAGQEFGVTLARLKRYLEQHSIGILIDNLEPALDKDGRFIEEHRNYIELLRILADAKVQSTTIITSRDRLCEPEINLKHYRLSGLDLAAWQQYFVNDDLAISKIHQTYGGNAKAMGIIYGIVREDYGGNIQEYWQENSRDPLVETDLKNLVSSQFNRLENLDPQAYILLCRLGCYRYQDLSKIPQSGLLCLLWDVEERKQRRVIKSLRNRSLLEFDRGKYWLHPVIRAEAKLRVQRSSEEWHKANRQIAIFLTGSVERIDSIQAGLTALEAYYHYFTVSDYEAAAKVILYSRENQWGQYLTLGTTLYRLGIIQPLLTAINRIIERVNRDRYRSELNNILGDLYWTTGKIKRAIACQQKTITTSQNCQQLITPSQENRHDLYYWRMLEVDSLLSLGLYNIDLWELAKAADLLHQVIDLAHNTKHHSWSEKAALGLALVNSHLNLDYVLDPIVNRLYRLIVDLEDRVYNTGRFTYFMQILAQVFFNHQQIEAAQTMWQKAIAFARSSHYTQIEAKSLIGLANIQRHKANYDDANSYHQQATTLLDKIGAKCDLAEAYFQWGITLQNSERNIESKNYMTKAIALFQQINAPKQVERIEIYCRQNNNV